MMNKISGLNILSFVSYLAIIGSFGCTTMRAQDGKGSQSGSTTSAARDVAAEEGASHVVEISFLKNSSELSDENRQSLSNMADSAMLNRKIESVKVIVWADEEYPSVRSHGLTRFQTELGDGRAASIKNYLQAKAGVNDIEIFNMASRPSAIQNLFNTEDSRVKRAMETAGIANSDSLNRSRRAKSAHAIVLFITE